MSRATIVTMVGEDRVVLVAMATTGPRGPGGGVNSINGRQGNVILDAAAVGADPANAASDAIEVHVEDGDPHIQYQLKVEKGAPNGYAPLDTNGFVPLEFLSIPSFTTTFTVDSEAEMLALDAEAGNIAIRTDTGVFYALGGTGDPAVLDNWRPIAASGVVSVNGLTGVVRVISVPDKDFFFPGTVMDANGKGRWVASFDATVGKIILSTARDDGPDEAPITVTVRKNDTIVATAELPDGETKAVVTIDPVSFTKHDDDITVDIAKPETGNPGSDLNIQLVFV